MVNLHYRPFLPLLQQQSPRSTDVLSKVPGLCFLYRPAMGKNLISRQYLILESPSSNSIGSYPTLWTPSGSKTNPVNPAGRYRRLDTLRVRELLPALLPCPSILDSRSKTNQNRSTDDLRLSRSLSRYGHARNWEPESPLVRALGDTMLDVSTRKSC